ncbi:MAG: ROK family protein [Clostridiales Family XIII bacterium]|jgi:glucokinase|nr:ROK family protein [Clostridiales Family XIII bacterium]
MEYSIGIDLGGTKIACGLVDGEGRILHKASLPTDAARGAGPILADIAHLAMTVCTDGGVPFDAIPSIGIGVPGSTNDGTGIVEWAVNLHWRDVPLRAPLSATTGKDIHIGNDANAAALGEYIAGAAREADTLLMLTLGTGIGGGLVLDGGIYEGHNRSALEPGHMVIRQGGRPCACGRRGCFERYASASGLVQTTREAMEAHPESALWDKVGGDIERVEGRTAFEVMASGDRTAARVVSDYLDDLACGVTSLINLFQPQLVCIGGGLSQRGEALLLPLRERVAEEVFSKHSPQNAQIAFAELGNDAGIIGAAHLHRVERRRRGTCNSI